MSRALRPRANISTASPSSSVVRPASPARTRDTSGSGRSATLRHAVLDRPLGRPQPAIAVTRARGGAVFVVLAPQRLRDLRLQRLLHDLPHGELEQLGAGVAVGHPPGSAAHEASGSSARIPVSSWARGCLLLPPAANRRRLAWVPSKSASPSRFPASLGLHLILRLRMPGIVGEWCARIGVPGDVPARALPAPKLTLRQPTPERKPGLPGGLEGRCSIQLSYRRVLVFCGVRKRDASFSGAAVPENVPAASRRRGPSCKSVGLTMW